MTAALSTPTPLADNPSPAITLLSDRDTFTDAAADYVIYGSGGCMDEFDALANELRCILFSAQEARENGMSDASYCKQAMDFMLKNVEASAPGALA